MKHRTHRQTALFCSLLLTAGAVQLPAVPVSAAEVYAELYVSPDGDDSNAGTKAAPLKTLAGARDAVRKCRDGMTGDIIVNFRGGVYRMTEAVAFDTRDSAPDADYVFPASCATTGDTIIPIRSAGSGKTVWFAPDGTTAFKAGSNMTKVTGTAAKIKTPAESGEYYIYVTDTSGKVLSKSKHLLRVGGGSAAMSGDAVEAASYDVQSGVDIENLQEGGRDVGYIENGDWIGFQNVDFKDGADAIEFCYASPSGGSSIEVRLDAPDGTLIGTCAVKNTGGWHDFATNTAALEKTTGKHDLYFVFKGGESYLFNLMSWKLKFPNEPEMIEDWIYGDLNGDLDVDAEDVRLHIDYLLGKIKQFPVEE